MATPTPSAGDEFLCIFSDHFEKLDNNFYLSLPNGLIETKAQTANNLTEQLFFLPFPRLSSVT